MGDVLGNGSMWSLLLWVWFWGWAGALAWVDIRQHRLPNTMVATAFAGCVAITVVEAVATNDGSLVVRALMGSLVAVAFFAVSHVLGGMGMGDVKYAAVTGWVLGTVSWSALWWGHAAGFVLAGCVVVVGLVSRRWHRASAIPFGPFMGLGSILVGGSAVLAGVG
jgi:leader peptidase (prepilin peptidase)/N-methyltransferase